MELSIIIITYNSEKYIKNCISSLLNALKNFNDYEIIISDNHSSDETAGIIKGLHNNKIKIINQKGNKGYSVSVNDAVKKTKFENLLIINPDTIIVDDAISELYKTLISTDAGIVGPKLLNSDGSFQVSSRRHFPTLGILFSYIFRLNKLFPDNKFFGKYNYTYINEDLQITVDAIGGACMIFSKKIYDVVDGFDENFFMYFEDTDFCFKIKNKGYQVLYHPCAQIIHHNNYSDNYSSKTFYFYQSFERFIYKYKNKIFAGSLVYYLAKLIKHISYLKKRLVTIK